MEGCTSSEGAVGRARLWADTRLGSGNPGKASGNVGHQVVATVPEIVGAIEDGGHHRAPPSVRLHGGEGGDTGLGGAMGRGARSWWRGGICRQVSGTDVDGWPDERSARGGSGRQELVRARGLAEVRCQMRGHTKWIAWRRLPDKA